MYRQSEKNLLSSNISSTCPHNMVNFGPLAAEIVLLVWGTPPNFNGFGVLAALLHGILVVGVSQTVALNRGQMVIFCVLYFQRAARSTFQTCILKKEERRRNHRMKIYMACPIR